MSSRQPPQRATTNDHHQRPPPTITTTGHSGMRRGAVVEVDDAVGEGFGGEELEADGAMARLAGLKPRPYNRQRRKQRYKPSGDSTRNSFKLRVVQSIKNRTA